MTEIVRQEQWKRGAILVPILARAPHGIVFVERAQYLRRHPGELGFPGGLEEPSDGGDPVRTALRELAEELTVGAEHVSVVGRLPDVKQTSNRLVIAPIVGVLDGKTCFSADGEEIVGTFAVPLESVIAKGAIYKDAELSRERARAIYAFDYEGRRIWGFTARILKSFVEAWTAPASTLSSGAEALWHDGPSE
jgi:8-oxo-dGTP pyrophosphatase MutT (NUDIX family)